MPLTTCAGSLLGDHRPDADKSAEELRIELAQLRDVWRVDRDELKKLHQVCCGRIRVLGVDGGVSVGPRLWQGGKQVSGCQGATVQLQVFRRQVVFELTLFVRSVVWPGAGD